MKQKFSVQTLYSEESGYVGNYDNSFNEVCSSKEYTLEEFKKAIEKILKEQFDWLEEAQASLCIDILDEDENFVECIIWNGYRISFNEKSAFAEGF